MGLVGATASAINPAFLAFFPELAADSWFTIGIEEQETGDEVGQSPHTWKTQHSLLLKTFASGSDQDGQDILIDSSVGGAWYLLNGAPNGMPDENMRVLFLQMTTAMVKFAVPSTSRFSRTVWGQRALYFTFEFCGHRNLQPFDDSGGGCTDELACNYDAEATEDDGSCVYADTYYDCDGNCLNDADVDGICDELEIAGCTDSFACNYKMDATDDDGSCDYTSCAGCTDEAACNFRPGCDLRGRILRLTAATRDVRIPSGL